MKNKNFCDEMMDFLKSVKKKYRDDSMAKEIVQKFRDHYKALWMKRMQDNGLAKRGLSYLGSTQSRLSSWKKRVIEEGIDVAEGFLKHLSLTNEENNKLKKERSKRVHTKSIHLHTFNGEQIVRDAIKLLQSGEELNNAERLIALAILSGRRTAELILTMEFREPEEKHNTPLRYWTKVIGFAKEKKTEEKRVREIPLFIDRKLFLNHIMKLRSDWNVKSTNELNKKYGKQISRKMKKMLPEMNNIHNARKLYALMAFRYFNDNNCSLARIASDYLGHKQMSNSILTYLNFRLSPKNKPLQFL